MSGPLVVPELALYAFLRTSTGFSWADLSFARLVQMFSIRVLGGYSLTGPDGRPVAGLTQRRVDAVLAVLAVAGDRGTTRHRLIGLLWGEMDERHARHNLSVALHIIRRALGADAVTSIGETLFLNTAVVSADTAVFAAGAESPPSSGAMMAYPGPLLDGFHVDGAPAFERWVEGERARLSREYAETLERLASDAELSGNMPLASSWWARAVEHDPYNTRLVLRLMRALVAAGDRANALRAAEAHRERLALELELEPEADLAAEVERIRASSARDALAASPAAPRPVSRPAPPPQPLPSMSPSASRETAPAVAIGIPARSRLRHPFTVAAVLVVVCAAGWWLLAARDRPIVFANSRQITRDLGLDLWPALSPNGREVAYMASSPEHVYIEVRNDAGGSPRALTGDWEGHQAWPRWTTNGDSIRFYNTGPTGSRRGGLWVIPRLGGQAVAMDRQASHAGGVHRWVEWRADTAFARDSSGASTLLFVEGNLPTHSLVMSPDESMLAYVVGNSEYMTLARIGNVSPSTIWVVRVGSAPVPITDSASLNVSPAWLPDGRLLFVSDRDGPRDLYVVRPGRSERRRPRPTRLTTGLNAYTVSVSANGRRVAYDRFLQRRNIWVLPIPDSGSVSIHEARPLTALDQIIEQTGVSADGRWLAFDSDLRGNQDIYIMPADGGEPRLVTRNPGPDYSPEVTADGREIVFHALRNGRRDIFLIDVDGSNETRLTDDGYESYNPSISPDGLRVAYERPGWVAFRQRATRDSPWSPQDSMPGGWHPRWSPDGTRVLSTRPGLRIVEPGGEEFRVPLGGDSIDVRPCAEWAPDGRSVYFCGRTGGGTYGVFEVPVSGGTPRLVVRFDDENSYYEFSVGPGRFYFTRPQLQSDVFVMDVVAR